MLTQKKFMNFRPAVVLSAGLIIGIILAYLVAFSNAILFACLSSLIAITLIVGVLIFFKKKLKIKGVFTCVLLLIFTLGFILTIFTVYPTYKSEGNSSFNGEVVEIFSETKTLDNYKYRIIAKGDFLDNKNTKVYLDFYSNEQIFLGSQILFDGDFSLIKTSDFTVSTTTFYRASIDKNTLEIGSVISIANKIKQKLLTVFKRHMPSTFGLNYAILTGDTNYVEYGVIETYRNVGIAHLFAVSGLHVGLMYGIILLVLKLFKAKGKVKLLVVSLFLLFYVYFCGFTASSLRAFIIIIVREFALILGEKPDKTTNVAISAIIVLLINPFDLFSAGFLLSYSVYLGLILLTKPLASYLTKFLPKILANLLAPCLIAQIVSMPILVDAFGSASLFSFLFNMLIIPVISFAYPFMLIGGAGLLIFESAIIFSIIPNLIFLLLNGILSLIDTKLFMLSGFAFGFSSVFYYLFLYTFTGKINLSAKSFIKLRIALLSLFVVFCTINFL